MMRKLLAVAGVAALSAGLLASGAQAAVEPTVTVHHQAGKADGFLPDNTMNGPFATAVVQPKGVVLSTPTETDQAGYLLPLANGTDLGSITTVSYKTYRDVAPADSVVEPSFQIGVYDADGKWDGTLVYEPYIDGRTITDDTWTTFDASEGQWWWTHDPARGGHHQKISEWAANGLDGYTAGYYGVSQGSHNAGVKTMVNDVHIVTGNQDLTDTFSSLTSPVFVPSKLTLANLCRVTKSTSPNAWQIANVAGGRDRTFHLGVTYNGKTKWTGVHTVRSGESTVVVTPNGGKATLQYFDGSGASVYQLAYANSDHTKVC
ncbi:MAG: hypothetical protein WCA46_29030 [Actinocatenispora sp.]